MPDFHPTVIGGRMIVRGIVATTVAGLALAPVALSAKPDPGAYTLAITAKPNPVVFTQAAAVSGKLTGPELSGVSVSLEEDTTAPLGDKFSPVGDKVTTATDGTFTIPVQPAVNTQYRAVAKTKPSTESPALLVKVRPRVDATVSDRTPAAGTRIRFAGAVLPAHDGAAALIQRRKSGTWKTVARATLTDAGAVRSAFSKDVRVRKDGAYRVKFPKDSDHVAGFSRRLKVNVS